MQNGTILEITDLKINFNLNNSVIHAVRDISFKLKKNEILGVVGESGSGKSVTCMSILKLLLEPPASIESGSIKYNDLDLLKISNKQLNKIRGKEISIIFQDPGSYLNPVLTIGYQLSELLINHDQLSKKDSKKYILNILDKVGIPDATQRYDQYPHEFSGGMRQRIMIAMAMLCKPNILIADEPTTALDVTVQAQIIKLIKELKDANNMSVIWVTHDLGVVAGIADYIIVMYNGMIVEKGRINDIYSSPKHPYTIGLINSASRNKINNRYSMIKGLPPDGSEINNGCCFYKRCSKRLKICENKNPPSVKINKDHYFSCYLKD